MLQKIKNIKRKIFKKNPYLVDVIKTSPTEIESLIYKRFYNQPFSNEPLGNRNEYLSIWEKAKSESFPKIDEVEAKYGYAIDIEWMHELALQTQVVKKESDICYQHGRLLYTTLSHYISENSSNYINILETGTARGFSSLCMAKALHDNKANGKILTLDVLPHTTEMYWNCIEDTNGPCTRESLLSKYKDLTEEYIIYSQGYTDVQLSKISIPRVHFAFLDAAHTFDAVMNEFSYVENKQSQGDYIFFDDYTPALFPGVVDAIDKICEENQYSKEIITISEQRGYVIARKL